MLALSLVAAVAATTGAPSPSDPEAPPTVTTRLPGPAEYPAVLPAAPLFTTRDPAVSATSRPTSTPYPTPARTATPAPPPLAPSPETWEEVAYCESGGNWTANTGNGFYGGLQFLPESWVLAGGQGLPHEAPKREQISRAHTLWELQGWEAWPVCSRRLGLR